MDIVVCVQQVLDPGVSLRVDEDTGVVAQLEPEPVYILSMRRTARQDEVRLCSTLAYRS